MDNLNFAIKTVPKRNPKCFSSAELDQVLLIDDLSVDEKAVLIRILNRDPKWIDFKKFKEKSTIANCQSILESLHNKNILKDDASIKTFNELEEVLTLKDCRSISQKLKLPLQKSKKDFMNAIKKYLKTPKITQFLMNRSENEIIDEKLLKIIKGCLTDRFFKIIPEVYELLYKLIFLFVYPAFVVSGFEDTKLFSFAFYLVTQKSYFRYNCSSKFDVYPDENSINMAVKYYRMKADFEHLQIAKKFDQIRSTYEKNQGEILTNFEKIKSDQIYERTIPYHLIKLTYVSQIIYIMSIYADALEKLKKPLNALNVYQSLLQMQYFSEHSTRGMWYDRASIILAQIDPLQAMDLLSCAIKEDSLCFKRKFPLMKRLIGLSKKKGVEVTENCKEALQNAEKSLSFGKIKESKFYAKVMPNDENILLNNRVQPSAKKVKIIMDDENDENKIISKVEEFVLMSYLKSGKFDKGMHSENTLISFFAGIIFFQEIFYDEIADVFLSPHQIIPLDFYSNNFYSTRQEIFDSKLRKLNELNDSEFCEYLREIYAKYRFKENQMIVWDLFENIDDLLSLSLCIGKSKILILSKYLLSKTHCHRSGMPDLILWNTKTKEYLFSEVKSTNDTLSDKQRKWIQFMQHNDINVEVSHVNKK